jgi:cell division protein FtsB
MEKVVHLADVKARLEERLRQVNADIRDYPQPIARCDAQLGGLLAERERIRAEIEKLEQAPGKPSGG